MHIYSSLAYMDTYSSSSFDSVRFIIVEHQERYFSFMDMKIIEERAFNLDPDKHSDIHVVLKKYKLTYLNRQIQLMAKKLVL